MRFLWQLAAISCLWLVPVTEGFAWQEGEAAGSGPELNLSGEFRARYESLDVQFRPLLATDDQVLALRTSVTASAHWPRWRLLGELMDARAELNDTGSVLNTGIVNTLEPLQLVAAYAWQPSRDGATAALRFGRMTVDIGSRRLIARNGFRNTRNSFTGVDFSWATAGGSALRAVYLTPVIAQPRTRDALLANEHELDDRAGNTSLRALHFSHAFADNVGAVELYRFDLSANELIEQRDLRTIGLRFDRSAVPGQWHFEIEAMHQTGTSSALVGTTLTRHLEHDAGFYHLEAGYSFEAAWSPRLSVRFDRASGDEDPEDGRNGRFDTVFGARRFDYGPTGIYGPFARANLETPGIQLGLSPAEPWRVRLAYRRFRLESERDAWTTTGLRDTSGQAGDSLGRQLSADVSWQPRDRRLRLDFGVALFSKGGFVRRLTPARSSTSIYYYVATTISFLDPTEA